MAEGRFKLRSSAVALLCAASVAACFAGTAAAQDVGTLQSRIDSAQAEAQSLATQIDANAAQIAQAQAEAQAAARREAEMTAVLEQGRAQLATLEQGVAEAQAALERARERLHAALELLADRLVAIYKSDTPDTATLLLEADGFDDLATRIEYLRAIEESDADLVARVRALREQVATQLAAVEQARDAQAAFNRRLELARAEIAGVRAAAEAKAAQLGALRARQASTLATLRDSIGEWTAQVQELQAVSAAVAGQEVASWFGDWAIPAGIVMCESGGNYGALNPSSGAGGAYQILPSTWELYGGDGAPQDAPKEEQDQIASQIWADSGSSAWVCAG